jgi:hypothetical protein
MHLEVFCQKRNFARQQCHLHLAGARISRKSLEILHYRPQLHLLLLFRRSQPEKSVHQFGLWLQWLQWLLWFLFRLLGLVVSSFRLPSPASVIAARKRIFQSSFV